MSQISQEDLEFIKKVLYSKLDKSKYSVFIFGSRATGEAQKYSDIDIGIEGETVPFDLLFELKDEFEESDIPYKIDLVDFSQVSEKFRAVSKSAIIPL